MSEYFGLIERLTPDGKQRMVSFLSGLLDKTKSLPGKLLLKETKEDGRDKDKNRREQQLEDYFARLTLGFSLSRSKEISKSYRVAKLMTCNEFNYGEIVPTYLTTKEFRTFRSLMVRLRSHVTQEQPIFYDLGSGTGKLLVAAALCYPFQKCIGIEILTSLYEESCKLVKKVEQCRSEIEDLIEEVDRTDYELPALEVHNSDFRQADWSDGSVVFASSTCYSPTLMRYLSLHSRKLKPGTTFVTLTKRLDDFSSEQAWRVVDSFEGETSWGSCTIYVQVKLS